MTKELITTCSINDSEYCLHECRDRICGKTPIIKQILLSEDRNKIQNLIDVLTVYDLQVKDYQ